MSRDGELLQRQLGPGDLELAGIIHGKKAFVGPEQVVVDLTNSCNNNCIGCWTRSPLLREEQPSDLWRSQEIAFDMVIHLLNDLYDLGTRRVRFTGGGEPLMHDRLDDILRACKQRRLSTCITSNGSLITPRWVELIASLPVDELAISLWAATPATYSRTHPNKTGRTFERIEGSLRALCAAKKLRPRVTLSNVLMAMNYTEAEQMVDFARDVGVDAVYFTVLDPVRGCTDGLLLSPHHVDALNVQLDRIEAKNNSLPARKRLDLENWEGLRRRIDSIRQERGGQHGDYDAPVIDAIPCYVGWIFCRILANGDIAPCCRGSDLPMGNINTDGFKSVWLGKQYEGFRDRALRLSKRDPYFAPIGCHRTCDNLMHNEVAHRRLADLTNEKRDLIERFLAMKEAE